jgi:hypothetical protein
MRIKPKGDKHLDSSQGKEKYSPQRAQSKKNIIKKNWALTFSRNSCGGRNPAIMTITNFGFIFACSKGFSLIL